MKRFILSFLCILFISVLLVTTAAAVDNTDNSSAQPPESTVTAPSAPILLSAKAVSDSSITLRWQGCEQAQGYIVCRMDENGQWLNLAETAADKLSFTDSGLNSNTAYAYTVYAFTADNGERILSECDSNGISAKTKLQKVERIKLSAVGSSKITVSWSAVNGAQGYKLYRKTTDSSAWKIAADVGSDTLTFTDGNLRPGQKYIYTVKAYVKEAGKNIYGVANKDGAYTVTRPMQPVLKSAVSASYNSVAVSWSQAQGAQGYIVYRKSSAAWKKVAQLSGKTEVTWTDKGLKTGKKYTYTVKSYVYDGDKQLLGSDKTKSVSAIPLTAAPVLKSTACKDTSVTVNWSKVSGATGYYVYRKVPHGSWSRIASLKKGTLSYTDSKLVKGTKYIYTVKSIRSSVSGKYSREGIEGATLVSSVTMNSIYISSKNKVVLKWQKQADADGYFIYKKARGKSWAMTADVKASRSSFSERNGNAAKEYQYTVVAYRRLNGKKIKGNINNNGISATLQYSDKAIRNVTKTYLGTSGAGINMFSYTAGTGSNHIVMTMEVHGWEDAWSGDGALLVKTGEKLIKALSTNVSLLNKKNYSVMIIPMANPDGLLYGATNNGSGRCTVYGYSSNGSLVKSGVDINRCFPAGFTPNYSARNYTGPAPLMSKEAQLIKRFIDSSKGSGRNIFIDTHGWYNQTIVWNLDTAAAYNAFMLYFPGTRLTPSGSYKGYVSGYAHSIGYDSILFEFPYISSSYAFYNYGYDAKFVDSIFYMIKSY